MPSSWHTHPGYPPTASTGPMSDVLSKIGDGLSNAFLMAYEVWWALVLGFAISDRPGLDPPTQDRGAPRRQRSSTRCARHRARSSFLVVLLRGDRNRQVALSE